MKEQFAFHYHIEFALKVRIQIRCIKICRKKIIVSLIFKFLINRYILKCNQIE